MLLEAFVCTKLSNSSKNHKTNVENYDDPDVDEENKPTKNDVFVSGGYIALWAIIVIFLFILWIVSIVNASSCPSKGVEKALGIVVAIFWWPIYWIVKWAGGFCTGKSKRRK